MGSQSLHLGLCSQQAFPVSARAGYTSRTSTSLRSCLRSLEMERDDPGTTMVMRDSPARSEGPTARLCHATREERRAMAGQKQTWCDSMVLRLPNGEWKDGTRASLVLRLPGTMLAWYYVRLTESGWMEQGRASQACDTILETIRLQVPGHCSPFVRTRL